MPQDGAPRNDDRRRRLSDALRENLKRRKAQVRDRVTQDTPAPDRPPVSSGDPEVL